MADKQEGGSRREEPSAGDVIGGFELDELLGVGGMGVVWSAEQLALSRRAAIKIVRPEIAADVRFQERFKLETQTAAGLDDPNVVPVFDAGEENGIFFMAMALVEGADLRRILESEGPLAPERAVSIVSQAASGLDAAHAASLVHRDVKPANILVRNSDGRVKIADFGVAKSLGSAGMTQTGMMVGTLDYLAPEQIESGLVDLRTDIYALGAVLYEMLTGRPPFEGDHAPAKLWAHVHEPPPKPSEVDPSLAPFDPVIAVAMAKDPEDRYPSAGELAVAAQGALTSAPKETLPTRRPSLAAPTAVAPKRPRRAENEPTAASKAPVSARGRTAGTKGLRLAIVALSAVVIIGLVGAGAVAAVLLWESRTGSTSQTADPTATTPATTDATPLPRTTVSELGPVPSYVAAITLSDCSAEVKPGVKCARRSTSVPFARKIIEKYGANSGSLNQDGWVTFSAIGAGNKPYPVFCGARDPQTIQCWETAGNSTTGTVTFPENLSTAPYQ